ncbi:MAG: DUF3990 domain-containing protein [Clostridia bacterium]|nr:DUF3990 domain-containing protein [Clostridia bacterium]
MILYHGSTAEVKKPAYGLCKKNNDYGQVFCMTTSAALAREWAVREDMDGCLNRYSLDDRGLKVLDLNDGRHSVLHWLCMVLTNRDVDITSEVMDENLEYLKQVFSLDPGHYDCITGWSADDVSFSAAVNFVSNGITCGMLRDALHLKDQGTQCVLVSPRAFERISFLDSEPVCRAIWYPKKMAHERKAAADYARMRRQQNEKPSQGLLMTDIVRMEMDANDSRLYL